MKDSVILHEEYREISINSRKKGWAEGKLFFTISESKATSQEQDNSILHQKNHLVTTVKQKHTIKSWKIRV